ncbi:MAG: hypothetical protein IBJ18_07480 [Phycisphaerales bacterium]|nr:hypothetical protein [Phycisphaerales bacterium]
MKHFSRRRTGYFGAAVLAMGLLLWARFLLITGHPKTAMATPEAPSGMASSSDADVSASVQTKPGQPGKPPQPHEQRDPNAAATSNADH